MAIVLEKGKPVVRRGRKATDLPEGRQPGYPKGDAVARTQTSHSGKRLPCGASPFDDHLRRISVALFAAGMLAVLLVANTGLGRLAYPIERGGLNWLVVAAGFCIVGIWLFPWHRYNRNLFLSATLGGLCLIALAVYFSGGWQSPFFPLYFFVVVFSAMYYSARVAAVVVLLTALTSLSPQLYDPHATHLVEHAVVRLPSYLALALVSGYMAREIGRREAEERYRTLVERIPAVTFVDLAGGSEEALYVSPQIEGMLGYTPEEWMEGRLWRERVHSDDRERILASDERFAADGRPVDQEYRLLVKDGSVVWVREETVLVRGERGEPLYVQGIMSDVTEKKQAEEALRKSQVGLAEAQRLAHLGSWEWDPRTGELYWSDETFRIYGFEPQSFVPTFERLLEVVHPDDRKMLGRALEEALRDDHPYDFEHRVVKPNGEVRVVHRQAEVVRDESGMPISMVGTVHDITERKVMEEQLEHRAFHDGLTDLPNRQLFVDRLGQALRRTRRSNKRSVAVLFMDLDGFKVVNDSLGHEVGDLLLAAVAERLKGCLRPEDTLARFGGDEFVVLLEDAEGPDDSVRVAERIIDELGGPFTIEGRELYARASIGIALGEGHTKDSDDLLRDADTAMYRAKDEGSGYALFDPAMYERMIDRLQSENDLKRAIEREEFVVHYQPIIDLRTGEICAVEALVRWEHPERGLLNPDEFVLIAEESGLVIPMGEQVLREACLKAKEWQEEHLRTPPMVMSVNLSAGQLSRPGLAETVEAILNETGLEGSRLTLDVTETVYVKTLEVNIAVFDRLRSMGVRFSIDDFGMGYSSLSYLKRLPADALKVDKSFVGGLKEDGADTAIVRMIIDLAHTLDMEVIAEGVETAKQAALLEEMGCDYGQGFHFSKPLPPENLSKYLTKASKVSLKGT